LERALAERGLRAILAEEVQWRLRAQQQQLGKIFGMRFPPMFVCRRDLELCRVRCWDKNWPGRLLGALPRWPWMRRLQRLGQELLVRLWRPVEETSPATRSRGPWTWAGDGSLFKKDGQLLGGVGLA
jgi:hypothetical protein